MKKRWHISLLFTTLFISTSTHAAPASKDSIKMLMDVTGAGNMGVQMMNQMIPSMKKMAPNAPEKFWQDIMKEVNAQELTDLIIPIYQKHLSEEDVKSISAFYKTPVGKKLISVQPAIMQESMLKGQEWGAEIARKVITKYKALNDTQP